MVAATYEKNKIKQANFFHRSNVEVSSGATGTTDKVECIQQHI